MNMQISEGRIWLAIGIFLSLISPGCDSNGQRIPSLPTTISVEDDKFVDNQGRQVILNGINVVSKSKEEQYLFQAGPKFYEDLKKWGFNCIRFIIIWDGLEPEPGVYNEAYLQEIDQRIEWCKDNDIFVVLDMHQDLFSVRFSDGAPEWATLDEGKPHVTGAIWSDAYMLSEAVQTSFDNFWANRPAPDGIGIQDHYSNLWKYIAARYADDQTVIGYDIMNEPFPGTLAQEVTPTLLGAYGQLVYEKTDKLLTAEELELAWATEENRMESLKHLTSQRNYGQVIDAIHPLVSTFETEQLQPMYQKVANAIRQVDSSHILFLEHSYYGNLGVKSSIERTKLPNGQPDPLVAYAPHAYDLVTDTKGAAASNARRVDLIFDRISQRGKELNTPVWLGEWGAYYQHSENIVPVAQHAINLIEANKMGHAYWSYDPDTENQAYFRNALLRPYPMYTNGSLINYHFDHPSNEMMVHWKESAGSSASTVIYIPWKSRLDLPGIQNQIDVSLEPIGGSGAALLIIPSGSEQVDRTLSIQFRE